MKRAFPSGGKRKDSSKVNSQSKPKTARFYETRKDVFLLPIPSLASVPRRKARVQYHQLDLIKNGVEFNSGMATKAIYEKIVNCFKQHGLELEDVEILKAIGDDLVTPNIDEIDYKNLMGIVNQGPLYVRSKVKLPGFDKLEPKPSMPELSDSESEPDIASDFGLIDDNEDKVVQSRIPFKPVRLIKCPLCFNGFEVATIEAHAAICKADVFDREDEIDKIFLDFADDTEEAGFEEHSESVELNKPPAFRPFTDSDLKDALNRIAESQREAGTERVTVRRSSVWKDFVDHMSKPWHPPGSRNYTVTFLGEAGVDAGGPKREFFTGR